MMRKVLSTMAVLAVASAANAAVVTWSPATTIAGDSDVSTMGTLDRAYQFQSSSPVTVNGVGFSLFQNAGSIGWDNGGGSVTVGQTTITNPVLAGSWYGVSFVATTFAQAQTVTGSFTQSYKDLLNGSANAWQVPQTWTLTMAGLTNGQQYQLQAWTMDDRLTGRTTTLTSGNAITVQHNAPAIIGLGGFGQYAIGTFTADGISQDIVMSGSASAQLNAFQLRAIPEPTMLGLIVVPAMLGLRRRRA